MNIDKLYYIIENRKKKISTDSYVSFIFKKGLNFILQKIGEETIEVIISVTGKNKKEIISEIADLVFHLLILLSFCNIKPKEILDELDKRNKYKSC